MKLVNTHIQTSLTFLQLHVQCTTGCRTHGLCCSHFSEKTGTSGTTAGQALGKEEEKGKEEEEGGKGRGKERERGRKGRRRRGGGGREEERREREREGERGGGGGRRGVGGNFENKKLCGGQIEATTLQHTHTHTCNIVHQFSVCPPCNIQQA